MNHYLPWVSPIYGTSHIMTILFSRPTVFKAQDLAGQLAFEERFVESKQNHRVRLPAQFFILECLMTRKVHLRKYGQLRFEFIFFKEN